MRKWKIEGQCTIGGLINILEECPPLSTVRFRFGMIVPLSIDSWRWAYDEATITYGFPNGKHPLVADLLGWLKNSVDPNKTFEGWKGGDYHFHLSTPIHVDERGDVTCTEISKVSVEGVGLGSTQTVWLHTKVRER